jgi:predicted DNA-binding protein
MDNKCLDSRLCRVKPLYREYPLARSIQITPSLEERRNRAASAAERRIKTQRKSRVKNLSSSLVSNKSRTPNSKIADFLNDLEDYNYDDNQLYLRYNQTRRAPLDLISRFDNISKENRIRRAVDGNQIGSLNDYMRRECIGAHCGAIYDPGYYARLKNKARENRQRDLYRELVNTDIPRSRQQRNLRSRQHDVADRLSLIDDGLDNDIMSKVHYYLKKKGHDINTNKRYLERRGW